MIVDRKNQAAGEDGEYEVIPPEKYQPKTTKCDRCDTEYEILKRCHGCKEFDEMQCECGHLGTKHSLGWGRSGDRIWVCRECMSQSEHICITHGDVRPKLRYVINEKLIYFVVWFAGYFLDEYAKGE